MSLIMAAKMMISLRFTSKFSHMFNQFSPNINHFTSETEVGRMGGHSVFVFLLIYEVHKI